MAVDCALVLGCFASFLMIGIHLAATNKAQIAFTDITASSGVHFVNENGATPDKRTIETMGSGVGVLDYDSDGRLDVVFVNGGGRPGSVEASHNRLTLYRNLPNGKFEDRTVAAHLDGSFSTYGMGIAIADYDNDGYADILLTGYPRCVLFHNNGDSTFTDVTQSSGLENKGRWATSAGWFDYDRDGRVDLVVANYVADFSWSDERFCGDAAQGRRAYCHPDVYKGTGVRLYHNEGGGHFQDTTARAGLDSSEGKCLGLVLADFDGDGWPDIFVANDSAMNFFYRNGRDGKFKESGLTSGAGFTEDGQTEAGMGVDAAYLREDSAYPDLYVTHLDNELNRLYQNLGQSRFRDVTTEAGLGAERSLLSGFGVRFGDFDNSGRTQILVANGHILDNIAIFHPRVTYLEPMSLFENAGPSRFRKTFWAPGNVLTKPLLGRGLALGDFDGDGRIDFVVNQNLGPPVIAHNETAPVNNWVTFELEGTGRSSRDAIGAEVTVVAGGNRQRAQIMGGGSYCSASSMELHFGLGTDKRVEQLTVRWPSGQSQRFTNLPVNEKRKIVEPLLHH